MASKNQELISWFFLSLRSTTQPLHQSYQPFVTQMGLGLRVEAAPSAAVAIELKLDCSAGALYAPLFFLTSLRTIPWRVLYGTHGPAS